MASAALVVSRRGESKTGLSLKNGPREVGFPQDPENPPISRSHIPFKIVARNPPRRSESLIVFAFFFRELAWPPALRFGKRFTFCFQCCAPCKACTSSYRRACSPGTCRPRHSGRRSRDVDAGRKDEPRQHSPSGGLEFARVALNGGHLVLCPYIALLLTGKARACLRW